MSEDIELPGGTRERIDKFISWWFYPESPDMKTFEAPEADTIVKVKGIQFYSLCEHHALPFFGTVEIEYLPNARILGLSKFARAVEYCARRFQTQERLTRDIADFIKASVDCRWLSVRIKARHLCMEMRGIQQTGTETETFYETTPKL